MKPLVYLIVLLFLLPFQGSVLDVVSLGGIKPDAALALLYCIGLLTGPVEAALAGIAVGLLQDTSSASLIGFSGFTRGLIGLGAGMLGRHVLDIASPSNILFIFAFSIAEFALIAVVLGAFYGSLPFFGVFFSRMLPAAFLTGVLGYFMLRLISRKGAQAALMRRPTQ